MAGWSPQEPTKTGYDSIVRTKRPADPERVERFTGFYACSQCGWFNRGGRCSCGRERVPVVKPIDIPKDQE